MDCWSSVKFSYSLYFTESDLTCSIYERYSYLGCKKCQVQLLCICMLIWVGCDGHAYVDVVGHVVIIGSSHSRTCIACASIFYIRLTLPRNLVLMCSPSLLLFIFSNKFSDSWLFVTSVVHQKHNIDKLK